MMSELEEINEFLRLVTALAVGAGNDEVSEDDILRLFQERGINRTAAMEQFEKVSAKLRRPVVREARVFEWNIFRRVITVTRLLSAEDIERIAELYRISTPEEIQRRIRSFTGIQFERFVGELLSKTPNFLEIFV